MCKYLDFEAGKNASNLFIHGEVFSFWRQNIKNATLEFYDSFGKVSYSVLFNEAVHLFDGKGILAGPTRIPGIGADKHWIPFWLDMRKTGTIVIGSGATVLLNYTATDCDVTPPFIKFISDESELIMYCDKEGLFSIYVHI